MNKVYIAYNDLSQAINLIESSKSNIVVIAGPTASGKSDFALNLAKKFNGCIINADSRQLYKEINIGAATPAFDYIDSENSIGFIDNIPHYLYSYASIFEPITLVDYIKDLKILINSIKKEYQKIFIVGGTGLYIDAYILNYNLNHESTNKERKYLEALNISELQKRLTDSQLQSMTTSDQKNKYRLIRMVEKEGKVYKQGKHVDALYFVINSKISELENSIVERTNKMFKNGLLKENIELRELEKTKEKNSIIHKIIGYKEFDPYFNNEISIDKVKELITLRTRQYAKRQITWFKRAFQS